MSRQTGGGPTAQDGTTLADAAEDVTEQAATTAEATASRTLDQAGRTLDDLARAVRDAGDGMRDERPEVATVADAAARQVERGAQYLREHDARDVAAQAQELARRQPLAVVAGGLAVGLLLGRLLRSAGTAADPGSGGRAGSPPGRGAGSRDPRGRADPGGYGSPGGAGDDRGRSRRYFDDRYGPGGPDEPSAGDDPDDWYGSGDPDDPRVRYAVGYVAGYGFEPLMDDPAEEPRTLRRPARESTISSGEPIDEGGATDTGIGRGRGRGY